MCSHLLAVATPQPLHVRRDVNCRLSGLLHGYLNFCAKHGMQTIPVGNEGCAGVTVSDFKLARWQRSGA